MSWINFSFTSSWWDIIMVLSQPNLRLKCSQWLLLVHHCIYQSVMSQTYTTYCVGYDLKCGQYLYCCWDILNWERKWQNVLHIYNVNTNSYVHLTRLFPLPAFSIRFLRSACNAKVHLGGGSPCINRGKNKSTKIHIIKVHLHMQFINSLFLFFLE